MNHTSAQILTKYLIDKGLFTDPLDNDEWPVFINHLPGGKDVQQAAAVNDNESMMDGRLMEGTVIDHPGIQVRVRDRDFTIGLQKARAVAASFSTIKKKIVAMSDGSHYTIWNVSRVSNVLPMGVEPGTRLKLFSTNFLTTIT